jgi:hypothetical protein
LRKRSVSIRQQNRNRIVLLVDHRQIGMIRCILQIELAHRQRDRSMSGSRRRGAGVKVPSPLPSRIETDPGPHTSGDPLQL